MMLALLATLCVAQVQISDLQVPAFIRKARAERPELDYVDHVITCVVDANDPDAYASIEEAIEDCGAPGSVIYVRETDKAEWFEEGLEVK